MIRTPPAPPLQGPFTFGEPTVAGGTVSLPYRLGADLELVEEVELPFDLPDTEAVRVAVKVLHLVAGVSYYKLVAPTPLVVPALRPAERALVLRLYDDGLREFAYRNGIDVPLPVELVEPVAADGSSGLPAPEPVPLAGTGALVPIGGGKDSALVAVLVPEGQLFAVNPVGAHDHLARALDRPLVSARRRLDPQLRRFNAEGAPNGHVPVTAITSAVSVLAAVAMGRQDVLMGIERSAEEPSLVTTDGTPVNHQFSKSYEAELLLREAFAPTGVRYLSLLRPLTELAIGAGVARRGLAPEIVSCNRVFTVWNENTSSKEQRACGECAKCLFTSLMIAPSSTPAAIEAQYGRALLDEPAHVEPTRALWSVEKPFDCVGERLETAAAVALLARTEGWKDQVVVAALAPEAEAMLAAAGVEPGSFLTIESVEGLPAEYRDAVAGLGPDLAAVPGLDPVAPGDPVAP
ncbi:UDP-N-acetyl-alpha-D-muramoyl-L-alanyl-L-glutamate epimerase [soil metagenome]